MFNRLSDSAQASLVGVIPDLGQIEVAEAIPADWEVIAHFNTCLASETEGKQLNQETIQAGVKALLAHSERGQYFVARIASQTVGQIMYTREWSDWRNGEIWWLQSVFVREDARQRGVFRTLFNHVKQKAVETVGVIGLRLYVENHNRRAISAYENLGLEEAGYLVMESIFRNRV